jgi:hypothetical protein
MTLSPNHFEVVKREYNMYVLMKYMSLSTEEGCFDGKSMLPVTK